MAQHIPMLNNAVLKEDLAMIELAKKEAGAVLSIYGYTDIRESAQIRSEARWLLLPTDSSEWKGYRIDEDNEYEHVLVFSPENTLFDEEEKIVFSENPFEDSKESEFLIGNIEVHFDKRRDSVIEIFLVI